MTERRFDENEVTEIFARATAEQRDEPARPQSGNGMTLAEIQEIGRQAGITTEAIDAAARSLDHAQHAYRERWLGLTVGVGRTVALDRPLTTDAWEQLVVLLRTTFDARGSVRSDGGLHQWTNGNLQVLVEPSDSGDRVRLRTRNGAAGRLIKIGIGLLGVATVVSAVTVAAGIPNAAERLATLAPLAIAGTSMLGLGLLRLTGWARTRLRQMDEIAEWLSRQPRRIAGEPEATE